MSVGLAALGASTVSMFADAFSPLDPGKPWSVSLSLRGFYTDNKDSVPHGRDGYGFDVNPIVRLHLASPQTDFTASYGYDAVYYDVPPAGNSSHFDQIHQFDLGLQHQFSEKYSISVNDTFVIGQDPDRLQQVGAIADPVRVSGNNIHNYGSVVFDAQLTPLFGLELGYDNSFWDYEAHKPGFQNWDGTFIDFPTVPPFRFFPHPSQITPSLAGQENRIEQSVHLDTHWSITSKTVLIVGYQFTDVEYTGNQAIQAINPTNSVGTGNMNVYKSSVRNSYSHYGYVGATHSFLPSLTGSIKVGARYTDNYNDPNGTTTIAPYVNLNLNWTYAEESYISLGFSHDRSSNDRAGATGTSIVDDSDTSVVFGTVHQRFTPKLYGTLTGTFQDAVINAPGNTLNGNEDLYYSMNIDLEYRFTHFFSMHGGYSYDRVDAALAGGSYEKNTVYLGGTISY